MYAPLQEETTMLVTLMCCWGFFSCGVVRSLSFSSDLAAIHYVLGLLSEVGRSCDLRVNEILRVNPSILSTWDFEADLSLIFDQRTAVLLIRLLSLQHGCHAVADYLWIFGLWQRIEGERTPLSRLVSSGDLMGNLRMCCYPHWARWSTLPCFLCRHDGQLENWAVLWNLWTKPPGEVTDKMAPIFSGNLSYSWDEPADLSNVPTEYLDVCEVVSKGRALSLPPSLSLWPCYQHAARVPAGGISQSALATGITSWSVSPMGTEFFFVEKKFPDHGAIISNHVLIFITVPSK